MILQGFTCPVQDAIAGNFYLKFSFELCGFKMLSNHSVRINYIIKQGLNHRELTVLDKSNLTLAHGQNTSHRFHTNLPFFTSSTVRTNIHGLQVSRETRCLDSSKDRLP